MVVNSLLFFILIVSRILCLSILLFTNICMFGIDNCHKKMMMRLIHWPNFVWIFYLIGVNRTRKWKRKGGRRGKTGTRGCSMDLMILYLYHQHHGRGELHSEMNTILTIHNRPNITPSPPSPDSIRSVLVQLNGIIFTMAISQFLKCKQYLIECESQKALKLTEIRLTFFQTNNNHQLRFQLMMIMTIILTIYHLLFQLVSQLNGWLTSLIWVMLSKMACVITIPPLHSQL